MKSQTVKEITQIVVFLAVVGVLLVVFLIYPLNRTKALLGRSDLDDFNSDSLVMNDPTPFEEAGFAVDTFRVEADGLTNLACVHLAPASDDSTAMEHGGTAVLLHDERFDRNAMIPLAQELTADGFDVIAYDQRACGRSTGEYHSDGQYEAADFEELARYLAFRQQINHPFAGVGVAVGADALLRASHEEERLDGIVLVEPYITAERWLDKLMDEHEVYWIPFSHSLFTWWYELRSDYAVDYTTTDDITGVACPTLLIASSESLASEEYTRLIELSDPNLLKTVNLDDIGGDWVKTAADYVSSLPTVSTEQ